MNLLGKTTILIPQIYLLNIFGLETQIGLGSLTGKIRNRIEIRFNQSWNREKLKKNTVARIQT